MDLDDDACYRAICARDARFDGRLFGGVKTTGIYCRPICPARTPRRENVIFFRSAAAAQEAGFRPCLRCRPEIAPDVAAWRGTSSTVSRALSLIEMGALDHADVDALAVRLGVGDRQLRRLFRRHLGTSPIAVAQTRRVLLAKQLIHDTRLPMTEVALAAGFGSVRRFNETFRKLFDREPSRLRRLGPRAGSNGEVTILLPYRPPYDWPAMFSFLKARAVPGIEVVADGSYARTIAVAGAHGVVVVEPAENDALRAAIRFPRLSAIPEIIARLRRLFDLAADPQAIGTQLSEDPALAPLVAARPGLRVPGAWDGFELAVRALLGQQNAAAASTVQVGRLVAEHGSRLDSSVLGVAGLTHVFPTAGQLASVDLSQLGVPMQRAAALSSLAAAVTGDPEIFGPRRDLEDAVDQLRRLPGLGKWNAEYIAMRELREPDAFPAADFGLIRAMTDGRGRRQTVRKMLARAERWRPWRAYAVQHLWTAGEGATGARDVASPRSGVGRGEARAEGRAGS